MPNSPRSASAAIAGRNGASSTIWEPMWKCKPSRSSLSEAMTRSIATGAASRLKPNFVFGPPVEIDGCVSGLTPGAIRIWTGWRSRGATMSCRRSMSWSLSSTTCPTPASCASWSSRRDFALPWRWMRPGSKPAFSAMCSSPPPATSHARPSSAMRRRTAVHANALAAKWTSKSAVRAANACLNARTRARMSSSEATITGVPNSRARSSASQPPSSRRPSSVRRLPSGYADESFRAAAMQRRILPSRPVRDWTRQLAFKLRAPAPTTPTMPPARRALRFALLAIAIAAIVPATASAASTATFTQRFNQNESGNIAVIGNTLENCRSTEATCASAKSETGQVASVADNDFDMTYVDVDGDGSTFDSSTATLDLPAGSTVLFAGLYWGARTDKGSATLGGAVKTGTDAISPIAKNTALLKVPGASSYAGVTALGSASTISGDTAYQHVADVTAAVKAAGSGVYTVANVQAGTGPDRYAGWSLVVAYRDLDQPPRNLSAFDGLTVVSSSNTAADINVSGFTTAPSGPVNTTLGAIAYEGDLGKTGDGMQLQGTQLSNAANPANDFFNSSVSVNGTRTMS